jgi:hypothetical protein
MDAMQEDEIATNVLSGGTSPYASIVLPREEKQHLRPFFTFGYGSVRGEASRSTQTDAVALNSRFCEWKGCFLSFMKKVRRHRGSSDGSVPFVGVLCKHRGVYTVHRGVYTVLLYSRGQWLVPLVMALCHL